LDDIPTNQNQAINFRLKSAAPSLIFEETDASSNNKKWKISANNERLSIALLNDAESIETSVIDVSRFGTGLGLLNLYANALFNNDERVSYGSRAITQSDNTVNNSETLQDWTAASTILKANNSYRVKGLLTFSGIAGAGFKWKIASDVSASSWFFYSGIVDGSHVFGRTNALTTISHATITESAGTPNMISIDGYIRPSALATVTIQFAQDSATGTNTRLMAGSFLEFSRLT
jgi:hypothetical protein